MHFHYSIILLPTSVPDSLQSQVVGPNTTSMIRVKTYYRECHTLQIGRNLGIIPSFYEIREAAFQLLDNPVDVENNCQHTLRTWEAVS